MRCNIQLIIFASLLWLGLAGCNELGWNPLDPEFTRKQQQSELETLKQDRPVLEFDLVLDVFAEGSTRFFEHADFDARILERRRDLEGGPRYPATASLVWLEAFNDEQILPYDDPMDAITLWPEISRSNTSFETLYQTRNEIGTVLWRRVTVRGRVCVAFQQGVERNAELSNAVLYGYYCSPAGEGLSEGQAEYVTQSITMRDISPS